MIVDTCLGVCLGVVAVAVDGTVEIKLVVGTALSLTIGEIPTEGALRMLSGCVRPATETEKSVSDIESSISDIDKELEDLDLSELDDLDQELAEIEQLT